MEGLGFWIFMGLFVLAVITAGSREKIEKQRTLQRLLDRNEKIDEDLVNRLLGRPSFHRPGGAYRILRVIGAFLMVTSIPAGIATAMIRVSEGATVAVAATFGSFFSLLPLVTGLGLFVAARFCERPDQNSENA